MSLTPDSLFCTETVPISQATAVVEKTSKSKSGKRYCKAPDCQRIIKSQGLCQRHGAKPRTCKVASCTKQAQGNFDGMCKAHFKQSKVTKAEESKMTDAVAVLVPVKFAKQQSSKSAPATRNQHESVYDRIIPESIEWKSEVGSALPLIEHLREGYEGGIASAWHRNEERIARGVAPTTQFEDELEEWEHDLAWTELLLLAGEPETASRHLAHAWGYGPDFPQLLSRTVCAKRGKCTAKAEVRVTAIAVPSTFVVEEEPVAVSDEEINDCLDMLVLPDFWGNDLALDVAELEHDFSSFDSMMLSCELPS